MRISATYAGIALGTTLGGVTVGTLEAVYRQGPIFYAMLMYGALWALIGVATALCMAVVWRRHLVQQVTWGLTLSLSLSGLVLLRFVVHRDIFHEAPEKTFLATLIAVLAAAIVTLAV